MPTSAQILTSDVALQRHADCVRRGYKHYFMGTIALDKVRRLQTKFEEQYHVGEHRNVRARRRARGEAAAVMLFYVPPRSLSRYISDDMDTDDQSQIGWTVLLTDGVHPARHSESLRDATEESQRLTLGAFQLLQRTRKGQSTPAWTWAMTRAVVTALRERVIRSARGDLHEPVTRVLAELYAVPGFAGVRSQVGHIVGLYRSEWRRRRQRKEPFPRLPRLGYVQRLPNRTAEYSAQ